MKDEILKEMDMLERDMRGLNPLTSSYIKRKRRYEELQKKIEQMNKEKTV